MYSRESVGEIILELRVRDCIDCADGLCPESFKIFLVRNVNLEKIVIYVTSSGGDDWTASSHDVIPPILCHRS